MSRGGDQSDSAVRSPQKEFPAESDSLGLVAASALFQQVLAVADAVAPKECVVLIEGESGTGKELIARRIHALSGRNDGPFIPVNCPAISESLFESQFYGHTRGAFTGATTDTLGIVRSADGGTLLLDEVGELPMSMQPKLLRLLQQREVTPVGAARPIRVNVRFVAATNRSLARSVAEGTFRSDLYHRLNIVRLEIPPLRNRSEDVEPLLDYFIRFYADLYSMEPLQIGPNLRRQLGQYPWPGNVRELAAYVERLYATDMPPMPPQPTIWDDGYLPAEGRPLDIPAGRMGFIETVPTGMSLAKAELEAIRRALQYTNFNRSAAARLLEVHRTTLLRKMREHGLGDM
jgi:transcriptional regulator with PAS, ATPase and Fis domain